MKLKKRKSKRGQRNQVSRVYNAKEWRGGKTDGGERATIAMKKMWSIGERLFRDDYKQRIKMFEALVASVALYGAEMWGWKNDASLNRVKRKYVK